MTENQTKTESALIKKVKDIANVMAAAGVGFTDYITQLTYILFLKMDDEKEKATGVESTIPDGYKWKDLVDLNGTDLIEKYEEILNELAKENVRSVITYWPEYLRSLKSSYSSSSSYEFKDKYNEVKYAKLLLIDDLGAEGVTSWSRDEILGTILQYRMQEHLPTFITSNLNLKELEEHLSVSTTNKSERVKAVRIIERIKQLTIDAEMIGQNNRK